MMSVSHIIPFIESTKNAFREFLGLEATTRSPYLLAAGDPTHQYDISGIIGLAGEVQGFVVMSFPREVALAITAALNDQPKEEIDDDVIDAIGEVVNIISGNAKRDLLDFRIVISLPSVVQGSGHRVAWQTGVPVVAVPLDTDYGPVHLFVSIHEEQET